MPPPPKQSDADFILSKMGMLNPLFTRAATDTSFMALPAALRLGARRLLGMATYTELATKAGGNLALKSVNVALWATLAADMACLGVEQLITTPYERSVLARAKVAWKEATSGLEGTTLAAADFLLGAFVDGEIPAEYIVQIEQEDQKAIDQCKQFIGGKLFAAALHNGGRLTPAIAKSVLEQLFATAEGKEYWKNITAAIKLKGGEHLNPYEKILCAINPENLIVDENTVFVLKVLTVVDFNGDGTKCLPLSDTLKTARALLLQRDEV